MFLSITFVSLFLCILHILRACVCICSTVFTDRYGNHNKSFYNQRYKTDMELSQEVWAVKAMLSLFEQCPYSVMVWKLLFDSIVLGTEVEKSSLDGHVV